MKVLIIGSGGREYSIGLSLKKDKNIDKIYFSPGNGKTDELGDNINVNDYNKLVEFAKSNKIDLTIVGPEAPLTEGIVDIFEKKGLNIFGPSKNAARLEGSKVFMKNFLSKFNIPTAKYIETSDFKKASNFIDTLSEPIVVKADGLCAGKGVIIAKTKDEARNTVKDMLSGKSFGEAGKKVIVEEFLDGYELSLFAICDGKDYKLFPAAQDHKRLLNGDKGPNTGGMGAYVPTPLINKTLYDKIKNNIIEPTLKGMQEIGSPYKGVLFIGIMVVNEEPVVLEYNVRFGDPECEVLMPLLKTSAGDLFFKASTGRLKEVDMEFLNIYAVGVVMASENYPYKSSIASEIIVDDTIDDNISANTHISYAGVKKIDGKLFATGGRVLLCIGTGSSISEAKDRAYGLCGQVHFAGKQFRTDIAYQALGV